MSPNAVFTFSKDMRLISGVFEISEVNLHKNNNFRMSLNMFRSQVKTLKEFTSNEIVGGELRDVAASLFVDSIWWD